jgi:hypothetical protein
MKADWNIDGQITDRREIKTKAGAVFMHTVKIATLGATLEVTVTAEVYNEVNPGDAVVCTGAFEESAGRLKLIARKFSKKAAA